MKLVTRSAVGRLLETSAGFIGFYLVALTFFPAENEIDSMILVIPFFLAACATAIIGGWLGGRLCDPYARACRRRQPKQERVPADERRHAAETK